MRMRVERFFTTHHAWLAGILERGVQRGEFTLPAPATKTARLVLSALQGALLVKRTTGDMAQFKDVSRRPQGGADAARHALARTLSRNIWLVRCAITNRLKCQSTTPP
jgi:hypothetical protein